LEKKMNRIDIDLSINRAVKHTHTAAGTAEAVDASGAPVWSVNAVLRVWGDNALWVGGSKAEAEANGMGTPANVPILVRLRSTGLWVDTASSGIIYVNELDVDAIDQ
jgi:hypothetical protein